MNKSLSIVLSLLTSYQMLGQTDPTGNPPANNTNAEAGSAWYRGGNNPTGIAGTNNIFGTLWNSPIYTRTNNVTRMKLNGQFGAGAAAQYTVNGYGAPFINTSGYMLLGHSPGVANNTLFVQQGAFSLLHLNGRLGTLIQDGGFKPWMQTGITFTDNNDRSYFGLRQVGTGNDVTETVISWSEVQTNSGIGPDDMVFRFTAGVASAANNVINTNNLRTTVDLDGLHIARFSDLGYFGLGNTFGVNPIGTPVNLYGRPQSLFHMSYDRQNNTAQVNSEPYGFMQITMRDSATSLKVGVNETNLDGLRIGIDNDIQNATFGINRRHLNSYLRWQEASSMIFQTDSDSIAGGIENAERLRITSVGAVLLNHGPNGTNPLINSNLTRIGISHLGSLPITKPMSLLHLGYNTGANVSQTVNSVNPIGWRKWMDLGMFVSNRQNHVFLGLKPEGVGATENLQRMDAVLAWGDKSVKTNSQDVDVFRFIFTGDSLDALENSNSRSQIGHEMMRIYPGKDSIFSYQGLDDLYPDDLDTTWGRVGIGNFYINGVNEQPTHKLDVIGNGRFRFLPDSLYKADSSVLKVVMVDSNGVLRWSDNVSSGFATCEDSLNGLLTDNSKIDLNDFNFYFTSDPLSTNVTENKVGVGYTCDEFMIGRFNSKWDREVIEKSTAGYFHNSDKSVNTNPFGQQVTFFGIQALVNEVQDRPTEHIGVRSDALNATINNTAYAGIARGGKQTMGGSFTANSALRNYGISARVITGIAPVTGLGTSFNVGGFFIGSGNSTVNYGVYSVSPNTGVNRAGYFLGALESSVPGNVTSDEIFKADILKETGALKTLQKLSAVTYKLKYDQYPQFNFNDRRQHGFIAQEVAQVLPELVFDSYHPGEEDSLGNEVIAPMNYKSLNYGALISLNTAGINELFQYVQINTLSDQNLKTNVYDYTGALDKVLAMRGVTHGWNYTAYPEMNFDSTTHVGFIAQEINQIDSLLTFVDDKGFMHVDYDKVVPVVAESIAELNDKIEAKDSIIEALQIANEDLNNRLLRLESCLLGILPSLCEMNQQAIQQTPQETQRQLNERLQITLSDRNTLVLQQNVPNPFAEKTVIEYSIPTTVQKAQLHFYNAEGKLINSVDLNERGNGELTVFANDLSSGIYTYSLVADGKVVATKKMMKN